MITHEATDDFVWVFKALSSLGIDLNKHTEVMITDRDRAMEAAIKDSLPNVKHRHCYYHISENIKQQLTSSIGHEHLGAVLEIFWSACLARTEATFQRRWGRLEDKIRTSDKAVAYFHGLYEDRGFFASYCFVGLRTLGMVASQRVEGINAAIKSFLTGVNTLVNLARTLEHVCNDIDEKSNSALAKVTKVPNKMKKNKEAVEVAQHVSAEVFAKLVEELDKVVSWHVRDQEIWTRGDNSFVVATINDDYKDCSLGCCRDTGHPCSHMFAYRLSRNEPLMTILDIADRWISKVQPAPSSDSNVAPSQRAARAVVQAPKRSHKATVYVTCLPLYKHVTTIVTTQDDYEKLYNRLYEIDKEFTDKINGKKLVSPSKDPKSKETESGRINYFSCKILRQIIEKIYVYKNNNKGNPALDPMLQSQFVAEASQANSIIKLSP